MQERRADQHLKLGSPAFHDKSWLFSVLGQIAIGVLVIAAIVGLLGGGLISNVTRKSSGSDVEVTYPRFTRHFSPTDIEVRVQRSTEQSNLVSLELSQSLIENLQIDAISPEPESVMAVEGSVQYTFEISEESNYARVIFHVLAQDIGVTSGEIRLENGDAVGIRQLVLP